MRDEDDSTETSAAVEAGRLAATLKERTGSITHSSGISVPVAVGADGNVHVMQGVMDATARLAERPLRRVGRSEHHELESFMAYVNDYKTGDEDARTVAFADASRFQIEALLDYHPAPGVAAAWAEHRARYVCPRSPEWLAWTALDGKPMTQDAFADFIESHLDELRDGDKGAGMPRPIEVLEMVRNLAVHSVGQFTRKIDPTTGTGTLICKTEHSAESTKIHRAFLVGLRVFEGGEAYAVEARIRFSLESGRASFSYTLHRRTEIERDAFGDVRKAVIAGCSIPVYAGAPEQR
jgi:uncharacterized protein YfdQ (DUF2303 family)